MKVRAANRAVGALAILVTLTSLLTGCSGHSAQAVCQVWNTDAVALHDKYVHDAQANNLVTSITDLVAAPNDLATLFNKMAAVAPTDIAPDFQALANAFNSIASNEANHVTDPWVGLASNLVTSIQVTGSEQRVDSWLAANCPGSIGVASSGGSGTTTPTNPPATPTPSTASAPYSGASELTTGQQMGETCSNDAVTLYAFTPATADVEQLTVLNLDTILTNWSNWTVNCGSRDGLSGDFTKLLFSGVPSGDTQSHIGYIDLTTGNVVDLTAARQGSSFQSTLLNESNPQFLGTGGGVIVFGSDQVAFMDTSGGTSVTSVVNPAQITPLPKGINATTHPETNVSSQGDSQYNPNFTLLVQSNNLSDGSTAEQVTEIVSGGRSATIPCTVPNNDSLTPVGWSDNTHLVVEYENNNQDADAIAIVTVNPSTLAMQCGANILPANDRQPSGLGLTYGGTAVTFSANTESGSGTYALPLSGGEPALYTSPSLPSGLVIWSR